MENGYDSVTKVLHMSQKQLVENGLPKSYRGKNMHSILQIKDVDLYLLMAASPFFESGIGRRKIKPIVKKLGEKKILRGDVSFEELVNIDGFSKITADKFLKGLPEFLKFLKKNPEITIKKKSTKLGGDKYAGQKWVITGTLSKPRKYFVIVFVTSPPLSSINFTKYFLGLDRVPVITHFVLHICHHQV